MKRLQPWQETFSVFWDLGQTIAFAVCIGHWYGGWVALFAYCLQYEFRALARAILSVLKSK